MYLETLDIILA